MYFETGQGNALSANAHHGMDQSDLEARAYGLARAFRPFLLNTVVGFIGPEYLDDGKQIIRAGLEDHFWASSWVSRWAATFATRTMPRPIRTTWTSRDVAGDRGCKYIMGIPGYDVMLNYQTTSFHDALDVRRVLELKPAPEFEGWLQETGVVTGGDLARLNDALPQPFQRALTHVPA